MSRLPFELFLALRYLRPKRTFVSIITLISVVGVALGVAVLVIVMSVMSGFDRDLRDKILGFNPHLKISRRDAVMENYADVMRAIVSNKNVRAVSPFVVGPVLIETQADTNRPAFQDAPMLRGIDPQGEGTNSPLLQSIVSGDFDLSGRGVLVGVDFANNLGLHVGDTLSIYSPGEIKEMKAALDRKEDVAILPDDYEVRGIFDTGYYEFNARFIVTSLENAQDLYGLENSVHGLFVTLNDPYQAAQVKQQLEQSLGDDFSITTWMEQNSNLLDALLVEKNVMFYLLFFIVFVAAFGITCTLITFVMMKTGEIGLMKAVGASNKQVMFVFILQSLIISIVGIAVGIGLGLFAIHVRNEFLHFMNTLTGFELFPASIYGFNELPARVIPHDIVIICAGSLIICLLATILPARYASKMKPVEALHHD
jgi:lipoprotein-releasing system permease protein